MRPILIKSVKMPGEDDPVDIRLHHGLIAEIAPEIHCSEAERIDGSGLTVMPPFAEAHIHLDTAFCADEMENQSGTLDEGIAIWQKLRPRLTESLVQEKAERVLGKMLTEGVQSFRVMVDVSGGQLTAMRALVQMREAGRELFDLQLIAFPQNGICSGDDGIRHMKEALEIGADGISAVPHLEETRKKGSDSIKQCFDLAVSEDATVHIFADETDESDSRFTEQVAKVAQRYGWENRTAVSHANAMEYASETDMVKLLEALISSGIHLVTCPTVNSVMNGRTRTSPKGRGIMRVKELMKANIPVACAHDDYRSPFYPLGTGSLLKSANLLVHLGQLTAKEELQKVMAMIGPVPRKLMGLSETSIAEGEHANLILLEGEAPEEWIGHAQAPRYVFRRGRILSYTPQVTSELKMTVPKTADIIEI
ncbi:amidohydrolase family protein [Salisediminibacterium beveridgei]|uniref:Cytosine deaminase n=1 Tax=Salisediminibacterium beveridgei TaxID=632773 RepID=A0A1D7QYF7_9BACI|nr:amidohydrolase family protein [Salisediminibacterium beveridgei]AOM84043.1 Cytosine deaminase [Salisediminibacterium beveridgei]